MKRPLMPYVIGLWLSMMAAGVAVAQLTEMRRQSIREQAYARDAEMERNRQETMKVLREVDATWENPWRHEGGRPAGTKGTWR